MSKNAKPIKFNEEMRVDFEWRVETVLKTVNGVASKASKWVIKSGRVYLYCLDKNPKLSNGGGGNSHESNGDYLEILYARITVYNAEASQCTLDWREPNERWTLACQGSLEDCLLGLKEGVVF